MLGRLEGVDALWVGEDGGDRVGGARRRSRMGGNGGAIRRPVDGGERAGGERGLDGREVCLDGSDPCWLSDVISKDGEQFVLFLGVIFKELLGESLALDRQGDHRGFRTSRRFGGFCPDGEALSDLVACSPVSETDGDGAGINEEVEFDSAKEFDPLGPLDVGGLASLVDGSWGERSGGEGETATTRTTEGILWAPGGRVLGGEVSFESELKLDYGGRGVLDDEGTGEVGDGVSESDGEGRRHFKDD